MNRKRVLLACLLLLSIVLVAVAVYYYVQSNTTNKPFWLVPGAFMTYEQVVVWNDHNETVYMTWNVTRLENDTADLHLISHGVNVTDGNVVIVPGEANWTTNTLTRDVLGSSDPSYVGKKWPFWIPTNAGVGSSVDTFYGASTISGTESISVLGQQRDCWVLEYDWTTANMKRWYDKSSGICLEILVVLYRQNITITINETAVSTNIDLKR